jgi:hypothetical protein
MVIVIELNYRLDMFLYGFNHIPIVKELFLLLTGSSAAVQVLIITAFCCIVNKLLVVFLQHYHVSAHYYH